MRLNTLKPGAGSKRKRLRVGRGASAGQLSPTCGKLITSGVNRSPGTNVNGSAAPAGRPIRLRYHPRDRIGSLEKRLQCGSRRARRAHECNTPMI